jgi:hypothetical protein
MERTIVIKGRIVGPTTIELDEPVSDLTASVEVILRPVAEPHDAKEEDVFHFLRHLSPGTRAKEDIDRQITEERASWESR